MATENTIRPEESVVVQGGSVVLRIEDARGSGRIRRWLWLALLFSVGLNLWLMTGPLNYVRPEIPEQHFCGSDRAAARIAIINVEGTITPPFTERWIRQIRQAADDATVRGVVLAIDSPGGFVADSHQIYREIQKLVEQKPVFVAMKRLAASGGYYIAMAVGEQGRIFAEPTTWTGSIGVIIPRYEVKDLADRIGIKAEPLVTGPLKDTLNPFRSMTEAETGVWDLILDDAFDRFVGVIDQCRSGLDDAQVRALATGQIYTANQALENHLVDEIGYVEDAAEALARQLQLTEYNGFEYRSTPGLIDALIGAKSPPADSMLEQFLQSGVPAAMYYASWNSWIPARQDHG